MSFGIDRRARSRKGKGLFRRAPDPHEVGDRLGWLLRRSEKLGLKRHGWSKDKAAWLAEVEFSELAPRARFALGADGELHVRAQTALLGPGYHRHVLGRLVPILDELEYEWTEPAKDPQRAMCDWLADELRAAGPGEQIRIGVPDHRVFLSDAPVLTALGPRDAAWRDAVLADPLHAKDAFPWWDDKPGRAVLARALLQLWHEVAWREPIDNAEQALLESLDDDLAEVRKADPDAPIPYADWAELVRWANASPERVEKLRARAGGAPATIGYRRLDMEIELSGGWTVRVPGAFTGRWEDDGAKFWATDGDRVVEFTSLTANTDVGSAALLELAPSRYPIVDRFEADDGAGPARVGRAEAHDEDHVRIVHGLVACAPHVAVLVCKCAAKDQPWALATWRSLRHDEPADDGDGDSE